MTNSIEMPSMPILYLMGPSQAASSTNWKPAVDLSKPIQSGIETTNVSAVVHSAIQRALPAASRCRHAINAAPANGRNVTSVRIGIFARFIGQPGSYQGQFWIAHVPALDTMRRAPRQALPGRYRGRISRINEAANGLSGRLFAQHGTAGTATSCHNPESRSAQTPFAPRHSRRRLTEPTCINHNNRRRRISLRLRRSPRSYPVADPWRGWRQRTRWASA
jgi:hypothetical protein